MLEHSGVVAMKPQLLSPRLPAVWGSSKSHPWASDCVAHAGLNVSLGSASSGGFLTTCSAEGPKQQSGEGPAGTPGSADQEPLPPHARTAQRKAGPVARAPALASDRPGFCPGSPVPWTSHAVSECGLSYLHTLLRWPASLCCQGPV